jgi:glycosyltransferase involved in cell wall biosynthesis
VGRLVSYKCTNVLIEACRKLDRRLLIAGDGPELRRLKKIAPKNVEFLGEVDETHLRNLYAHCRALLFAADEDFGMVPLEAQSYGRPVIAFGKGGSLETVLGTYNPIHERRTEEESRFTGVFFREQTADSLAEAILSFESSEEIFRPRHIQAHARSFDTSIFVDRMRSYISSVMANPSDSENLDYIELYHSSVIPSGPNVVGQLS